ARSRRRVYGCPLPHRSLRTPPRDVRAAREADGHPPRHRPVPRRARRAGDRDERRGPARDRRRLRRGHGPGRGRRPRGALLHALVRPRHRPAGAQVTPPAAILDIDGTLVDSNYFHAIAWYRAFRAHDHTLPMWRIQRAIGMGGDQMIAALLGDEVENRAGDAIRDVEKERYFELIDEVQPREGSRELIEDIKRRGSAVVLASSAKPDEVDRYLDLLGARELGGAWRESRDDTPTKHDM